MTNSYQELLGQVAKLRLRATSLLAESAANAFEAAALFHQAEMQLRSAREILELNDHLSRIRIDIERCWCLLDGSDPKGAENIRRDLERELIAHPEARPLVTRLDVRQSEALRAFQAAISKTPVLAAAANQRRLPTSAPDRARAIEEVRTLLGAYPGTSGFWWFRYRFSLADGDMPTAWESLRNAERVGPDRSYIFRSLMLLLASSVLSPEAAREYVDEVGANIEHEPAEVCLYYAFAELKMEPDARTSPGLERARAGTILGEARASSLRWKSFLRVARRMIDARASGTDLTLAVLEEEGLADLLPLEKRSMSILGLLESASTPELELRWAA